jgi:hypothetical protein
VAGLSARTAVAAAAIEVGHASTWKEPSPGVAQTGAACPAPAASPWRISLHATWSPLRSRSVVSLGHTRRQSGRFWREAWDLAWAGRLTRDLEGRVAVEIRPGAAFSAGSDVGFEPDPLGGTRFWTSRTPSRVTAELRFSLGRPGGPDHGAAAAGDLRGRLLARCFTASEKPRLELWLALTMGTPAPL